MIQAGKPRISVNGRPPDIHGQSGDVPVHPRSLPVHGYSRVTNSHLVSSAYPHYPCFLSFLSQASSFLRFFLRALMLGSIYEPPNALSGSLLDFYRDRCFILVFQLMAPRTGIYRHQMLSSHRAPLSFRVCSIHFIFFFFSFRSCSISYGLQAKEYSHQPCRVTSGDTPPKTSF